jgi:TonB family protein
VNAWRASKARFCIYLALRIARNIPSRGVPRLLRVLLLFGFLFSFSTAITGQPASDAANSLEQIQSRIERARALIAAHRLDTAASELESVRAATHDYTVRNITSIMLMSVYLEEGNYGRAEALLEENYQDHHQNAAAAPGNPARSAQKDESFGTYFALAGQAVNGARTHLARYRSFGINTSGASLPAEAISDLNRLRSLLERMIAQAKEISNGRRAYDSLSLLEDVLGIRLSLAKDSEDQAKWEAEYASAREALASSQTQIASLGGIPPLRPAKSPVNKGTSPSPYSTKKISETPLEIKASQKNDSAAPQASTQAVSSPQSTAGQSPGVDDAKVQPPGDAKADEPPISDAGSLNAKATKMVQPRYPPSARRKGAAGLVRVHVIVDETGKVIAVSHTEGPMLLRTAAEEAARQWSFGGISSAGGPARFSGYIDFNFTL